MKRKTMAAVVVLSLILAFCWCGSWGVLADDAIALSTAADLQQLAANTDGSFYLKNDIKIENKDDFTTIPSFSGTLDGKGFSISGLDKPLFSDVNANAHIKNLILKDFTIDSSLSDAGALAARATGATIDNCGVSGTITGTAVNLGALVGTAEDTAFSACYGASNTKVTTEAGDNSIGGLVGATGGISSLTNCYFNGSVTGVTGNSNYTGGLVGSLSTSSTIKNSYTCTKNISGGNAGSLVGNLEGACEKSYFLNNNNLKFYGSSSNNNPSGAEAKEDADFKSGSIAYQLQSGQSNQVWGQDLSSKNNYPVLTSTENKKVLQGTLKDNNDKELAVAYFNSGSAPSFSDAEKNNMTLKLYTDKEMTKEAPSKFTEDVVLYGKYVCTVTYEVNGGSKIDAVTVDKDSKLTAPANPSKSGYSFGGWYKEKELKNKWDFNNDTVTENMTLYAKWTNTTAAASNNSDSKDNPKAGDEGIPVIYYILFVLALVSAGTASGMLLRRRR